MFIIQKIKLAFIFFTIRPEGNTLKRDNMKKIISDWWHTPNETYRKLADADYKVTNGMIVLTAAWLLAIVLLTGFAKLVEDMI